jgi:GDP-L-fucose synthase
MSNLKKILITGGSGFLGRQIVAQAKNAGYEVFAPRSANFDLETGKGVDDYFSKENIDCIIHSAAYYGGIGINQIDPVGLLTKNTKMALCIFEAAAKWKVKKIISVGSACSYPGAIKDNLKEENMFQGRCHHSIEAYGFTKRIHLTLQSAFFKQHSLLSNQVVLTNLYGEYDVFQERRSHVVSALIKKIVDAKQNNTKVKAWGTGKPIREFLHVEDAAAVIVKSIQFEHDLEPVNANGEEISIYDLSNLIAQIVGLDESQIQWDSSQPDGVARKVLDGEKLKKLLPDFQPMSLRAGLDKTIRWYLENKEDADARA